MIDAETVVRESAAWVWYPPGAKRVETDEFLLVRWPAWFGHDAAVLRFAPHRPAEVVAAEVLDRARRLRAHTLTWTHRFGAPPAHEDLVRALGAELIETVEVLACSLDPLPELGVPAGIDVRWLLDPDTARDASQVETEAFEEGTMPPAEQWEVVAREEAGEISAGRGGRVVAYLGGRAVGTLGVTVAGPTARLWAAATIPVARHRGVFRACMDEVLAYAVAHGAVMSLAKGRVETSAPIFRRAGFTPYATERTWLLQVT